MISWAGWREGLTGPAPGRGAAVTLAVDVRLHLLERIGRLLRFSPEGRPVRVWVEGMPGADETEVVPGTITELRDGAAVVFLREPGRTPRWVLAVPRDAGWGLEACGSATSR